MGKIWKKLRHLVVNYNNFLEISFIHDKEKLKSKILLHRNIKIVKFKKNE